MYITNYYLGRLIVSNELFDMLVAKIMKYLGYFDD